MVAVTIFIAGNYVACDLCSLGRGGKKVFGTRVWERRPRLHAWLSVAISAVREEVVVIVYVTGS